MNTTSEALHSELDLLTERCETLAAGIRLRGGNGDDGGPVAWGAHLELPSATGLQEAA